MLLKDHEESAASGGERREGRDSRRKIMDGTEIEDCEETWKHNQEDDIGSGKIIFTTCITIMVLVMTKAACIRP